eukprot:3932745-Rhodomonas_salina.1
MRVWCAQKRRNATAGSHHLRQARSRARAPNGRRKQARANEARDRAGVGGNVTSRPRRRDARRHRRLAFSVSNAARRGSRQQCCNPSAGVLVRCSGTMWHTALVALQRLRAASCRTRGESRERCE